MLNLCGLSAQFVRSNCAISPGIFRHTINLSTTTASYKDKRKIARPKNEQYRFENTHEAIIDEDTWAIVQRVREGKRRRTSFGEENKYNGLLFCADCESKMYFVRGRTISRESFSFICSRYRKHMGEEICTPHSIREVVLDQIVLEEIRRSVYYARNHTQEFIAYITKKSSAENRRELNAKMVELARQEKRDKELSSLFKRLYEDNVLGRVTNEQFRMLSEDYNEEQRVLRERIPVLQSEIDDLKAATTHVEKFIELANRFTDPSELTPELLRTFISKIVIYERSEKRCKHAEQRIDIYFRHIGYLGDAEETSKATEITA